MGSKLNKSVQIWRLAKDLGLKPGLDPSGHIVRSCQERVVRLLNEHSGCKTLDGLLEWVAGRLETNFVTVRTQEELLETKKTYLDRGERMFVRLEEELADDVFGITFRLRNREAWEPQFVSVIDCRGEKGYKSYFTKWHEIAHLLTQTRQMRLKFMRTHSPGEFKDPEERLMDVIAGKVGFLPELVAKHVDREISFSVIEELRQQICPEASRESALYGFVESWPQSCLLVRAALALKRKERVEANQGSFDFHVRPVPVLRAVRVTSNEPARLREFRIYPNMRVPGRSVIHRIFSERLLEEEAKENLTWWKASDGTRLPDQSVLVKGRRSWNSVDALILPLN